MSARLFFSELQRRNVRHLDEIHFGVKVIATHPTVALVIALLALVQ